MLISFLFKQASFLNPRGTKWVDILQNRIIFEWADLIRQHTTFQKLHWADKAQDKNIFNTAAHNA